MFKKLLAVITILCMGVMLVPVGLSADPPANAVAKVTHADGTVEYCTDAAKFVEFIEKPSDTHTQQAPGDVFTLMADITDVPRSVCIGFQPNDGTHYQGTAIENVTLDGAGHKLTAKTNGDWNIKAFHELVKVMGTNCTLKNINLDCKKKAWGIGAGDCQHTRSDGADSGGRTTKTATKGLTLENVHAENTTNGNYAMKLFRTEVYASDVSFTASKSSEPTLSLDDANCKLIFRGSKINIVPYEPTNSGYSHDNQIGGKVQAATVTAKNYTVNTGTYKPSFSDTTFYYWNLEGTSAGLTPKRKYIVYRDNLPGTIPCWRTEAENLVKEDSHNTSVKKTIKNIGTGENEVNFTREGWVFTGWNTKPDGTGSAYAAGDTVWGNSTKENSDIWTDDLILYAQWEKISIPINFEANAAKTGGSMPETVYQGVQLNLPANGFICPGWTFDGWNTHPNGGSAGMSYADGAKIESLTEPLTLYAQWKPAGCTVSFNANGGTGTTQTQNFDFNKAAALSDCAFTFEGYIFAGWGTDADGNGDIYAPGGYYCFTDPNITQVTLYALWLPEP